jgi:hypothetical protein
MGGATVHLQGCKILELIEEYFPGSLQTKPQDKDLWK